MKYFLTLFIFLINMAISAHANSEEMYPFPSHLQAEQFNKLTKEIRCVVCQNQTLADSNALLAKDLRNKIYQMIVMKKSDEEIKTYLVSRYGKSILLMPPLQKLTFILWLFPWIALLFAMLFLMKRRFKHKA